MPESPQAKRDAILDAAPDVFGRYGYRRTSMDLLARAAKVSRPALYLHFTGKEDVFRAMAQRLVDGLIADAEEAARAVPGRRLDDRLHGALAVKLRFLAGSVRAEFRSELLADAAEVAPEILDDFAGRYIELTAALLASERENLDLLDVQMSAHDAAVLLHDALTGIGQADADVDELDMRLRRMVGLTLRGLRSGTTTRRRR